MRDTLAPEDSGKRVINTDGTEIGRIVAVEDGTGYVALDPGLIDTIRAKLGWGSPDTETPPLDAGSIEKITDDAVYLCGRL